MPSRTIVGPRVVCCQIILGAGIFKTLFEASGFPAHLIDYARATRPDWPRPAVD
jgi:hypothetical protein